MVLKVARLQICVNINYDLVIVWAASPPQGRTEIRSRITITIRVASKRREARSEHRKASSAAGEQGGGRIVLILGGRVTVGPNAETQSRQAAREDAEKPRVWGPDRSSSQDLMPDGGLDLRPRGP